MEKKIILFPLNRRQPDGPKKPEAPQELTATIPRAEPGPAQFVY